MLYFNPHISTVAIVLFALALLALAYICAVYCRRLYLIRKRKRQCEEPVVIDLGGAVDAPMASIVIFTRNEPEALVRNLPMMLEQDYPAPYEVIVVNEGADVDTNLAVSQLQIKHPNLYLTFTPDGARSLSRKKLALTIGVKAAKGDIVVISDATVHIDSPRWLRAITEPFANPSTQVVMGYGAPIYPDKGIGRQVRIFDLAADSATWLAAAIAHQPYRACGYNLAYRRQVFFDNKGFSRSLNLRDGDDDIFVNEITNGHNTEVQLSDASMARREAPAFKRQARDFRMGHSFTGRRVPIWHRRMMAFGEWMMWAVVALSAAGVYFSGMRNVLGLSIAAMLVIAMLVIVGVSWTRTLRALHAPVTPLWTPLMAATRPLRNMCVGLRARTAKSGQYTWQ